MPFTSSTIVTSSIITDNYFKVNFPADEDGVLCGIDQPAYSYVYFANPPQIVPNYHNIRQEESVCHNALVIQMKILNVSQPTILDVHLAIVPDSRLYSIHLNPFKLEVVISAIRKMKSYEMSY